MKKYILLLLIFVSQSTFAFSGAHIIEDTPGNPGGDYISLMANPEATTQNKQYSVIITSTIGDLRCGGTYTPPYLVNHYETVTDTEQVIFNIGDCINEFPTEMPANFPLAIKLLEYEEDDPFSWNYGDSVTQESTIGYVTWGCADPEANNYNPDVTATAFLYGPATCTYDEPEPPATTTPGTYDGPNFQEWLFVNGLIIFFLSFPFWSRLYAPIKKLFNYQ